MADERKELDLDPREYSHQSTPGPVAKGMSTALMQGAFEKFGHAFTDTGNVRGDQASEANRMAPWRQQGQNVANALRARWETMEYENFQASAIEPYIDAKKKMLSEYQGMHADLDSGISGRDPQTGEPRYVDITTLEGRQEMIRLRGQLEKTFYNRNGDMDIELFNFAHKYPQNTLISKRIESIATAYSEMFMKSSNPDQTLAAEGAVSDIRVNEMNAETASRQARTAASKQNQPKDPKNLTQASKHPDYENGGAMRFLLDADGGQAIMYGNRGVDDYRDARSAFEQKLIAEDPDLANKPAELEGRLLELKGRIRNLAASTYLKRNEPEQWALAKETTPWLFDFEKKGEGVSGSQELGPDDERGYKGDKRITKDQQKDLYNDWISVYDKELDQWAADPKNDLTVEAAMEHMEEWVKNAVVNGGRGIDSDMTIAINPETKNVRVHLIEALLDRGRRTAYQNNFLKEAHPIASAVQGLFGTGRPSARGNRMKRAAEKNKQKRAGLLGE